MLNFLSKDIPIVTPTLRYNNPFELLIAVILSAQCTDKQVNKTTAQLFNKYKTPFDFAALNIDQLALDIKGCGLYRNKSLYIINACQMLVDKYGGQVPNTLMELQALPGVGRKTANVVLNLAFGQPTFPVDTHIYRVSRRLRLSGGTTPRRVEKDLCDLIPPIQYREWHHRLIHFGRTVCTARKPNCDQCVVMEFCSKEI